MCTVIGKIKELPGVSLLFGHNVTSMKFDGGSWHVETSSSLASKSFKGRHLILAAGPATRRMMRKHLRLNIETETVIGVQTQSAQLTEPWLQGSILGAQSAVDWGCYKYCGCCRPRPNIYTTSMLGDSHRWTTHLLAVQAEFLVPRPLQKRVALQVAKQLQKRAWIMKPWWKIFTWQLRWKLEEIVDLETAPLTCVRALAAMEFTVQQNLHSWVAWLNTEKGVAPSRSMMVAYAMDNIPSAVPDELRAGLVQSLNGSPGAQHKWLACFRRQWQCRVGRLPVEDVVTAFWQWINFAWAEAEEAKETPLVLNADETCIAWVKGGTKYLRPCDLKPFAALKDTLREVWRERKGGSVLGTRSMEFRMSVLFDAMMRVLPCQRTFAASARVGASTYIVQVLLADQLSQLQKGKQEAKEKVKALKKQECAALRRKGRMVKAAKQLSVADLSELARVKAELAEQEGWKCQRSSVVLSLLKPLVCPWLDKSPPSQLDIRSSATCGCGQCGVVGGRKERDRARSLFHAAEDKAELLQELRDAGEVATGDVAMGIRQLASAQALWQEFRAFVVAKVRESGVQRWTIAMAMHVEASVAQQCPYVHFHWMFDSMTKAVTLRCRDGLRFKGSLPYQSLEAPQARGRACKRAFDQGHFYLSAGKIGGVFMETTCLPFKAFPVTPEWITNLWQTDKVTADTATLLYIRAKKRVKQYTENVRAQTQLSRQLQVKAAKADAVQALEAMKRPSVRLEAVDTLFMPQFPTHAYRRKFLVLDGPTRVGKTQFAKALAGEAATLEVNCAGSVEPDLRSFDPTLHRAIVFDEASANLVLRHKKLFQGGVEEVSMAASALSKQFRWASSARLKQSLWRYTLWEKLPRREQATVSFCFETRHIEITRLLPEADASLIEIVRLLQEAKAGLIEIIRLLPEAKARPDTCSHVSSGNPAGLIEIVRLLPEAVARPDTCSHVSFGNPAGLIEIVRLLPEAEATSDREDQLAAPPNKRNCSAQQQFYSRDSPVRLLFLN
ncbi:unnamed protein product [Symbiodinium sp. KB8]|nr:unnamed protein product [Symbiodinium sp. KB8]